MDEDFQKRNPPPSKQTSHSMQNTLLFTVASESRPATPMAPPIHSPDMPCTLPRRENHTPCTWNDNEGGTQPWYHCKSDTRHARHLDMNCMEIHTYGPVPNRNRPCVPKAPIAFEGGCGQCRGRCQQVVVVRMTMVRMMLLL
jgi:hypothetical protein